MVFNATSDNISVYRGGQFYWWGNPDMHVVDQRISRQLFYETNLSELNIASLNCMNYK